MRRDVEVPVLLCVCIILVAIAAGFHSATIGQISIQRQELRPFPAALSPDLPYDVDEARIAQMMAMVHPKDGGEYSPQDAGLVIGAQRDFDILSWQAFLALNWPHKSYTEPEAKLTDSEGEPLWSYWVPMEKIFLDNGAKPPTYPWDPDQQAKAEATSGLELTMSKAAWRQEASTDDNFQAFSGPLIDQYGKWVRYEALADPEEFDYIYRNRLYSLDGQIAFSERDVSNNGVDMPVNEGQKHGAIEIKLAWKEMGANDDLKRFYTKKVRVMISGLGDSDTGHYQTITAGLVGMHIAMHTQSSPEWIWSTFEQIDNVRRNPLEQGGMSRANFFNPGLKDAPVNELPLKNGGCTNGANCTTWFEERTTTPVQVARIDVPTQPGLNPLDAQLSSEGKALNAEVQAILHKYGSVFQYYELIGTQWPVHKNAPAYAGGEGSAPESITNKMPGDVVPVFLVNTTMETYFQKGAQAAGCLEQDNRLTDNCKTDSTAVVGTESCVGCHYSAGICVGYKRDVAGNPVTVDGLKVPVYGENGHFGRSAHAHYSWMLQIETSKHNVAPATEELKKRKLDRGPKERP